MKTKRSTKYSPTRPVLPMAHTKEKLHYLSGIKVLRNGADNYLEICGKKYETGCAHFAIPAIYLGIAETIIRGTEKESVAVSQVLQLTEFMKGQDQSKTADFSIRVIKEAFQMEGYGVELSTDRADIIVVDRFYSTAKYVRCDANDGFVSFYLRGETQTKILQRLLHTLHWSLF